MKSIILSALTLACILTLATGLHAEDGYIVAHVDQEFVAAGKTFPAGTYTFFTDLQSRSLMIRNSEGNASAFVVATSFDGRTPDHAYLRLERIDGVSYLSEIATPLGVYTLASPHVQMKEAKAKQRDTFSSAGTN